MSDEALPRAQVRRRRLWLHVMWVIPLVAAVLAGYLIYERMRAYGPQITIQFRDGSGIRVNQTPVKYRGVQVGEVTGIGLSDDRQNVLVKVRLQRTASEIATEGAQFWIVRPQVGWGNVTGLNTVISGPELHMQEGKGSEPVRNFTGLENAPMANVPGVKIVLKAERPVSLRPESPIYYRGVQVGIVQRIELAGNATAADIHAVVWERYANLVRTGSAFWNASGVRARGGILKGLEVEVESLRAIIAGGIEFASPDNSPRARSGTVFFLHREAQPQWLAWSPRINIPPDNTQVAANPPKASAGASAAPKAKASEK